MIEKSQLICMTCLQYGKYGNVDACIILGFYSTVRVITVKPQWYKLFVALIHPLNIIKKMCANCLCQFWYTMLQVFIWNQMAKNAQEKSNQNDIKLPISLYKLMGYFKPHEFQCNIIFIFNYLWRKEIICWHIPSIFTYKNR